MLWWPPNVKIIFLFLHHCNFATDIDCNIGDEQIAQWSIVLATFAEDPGTIPSIHRVTHKHLVLQSQEIWHPLPVSKGTQSHMQENIHTLKMNHNVKIWYTGYLICDPCKRTVWSPKELWFTYWELLLETVRTKCLDKEKLIIWKCVLWNYSALS